MLSNPLRGLTWLVLFTLAQTAASADAPRLEGDAAAAVLAALQAAQPDLPVLAVEPASVAGLYAVQIENGTTLYVTADGGYLFAGDLYAITPAGFLNESERQRSVQRVAVLEAIDRDQQIVFSPRGETLGHVTVFTDVDCGFCQKLHREVPALNEMGIEVRYMAYPRAGIGSPSYDKIATAWCADDPQATLTAIKFGQDVPVQACDNPVAEHYRLGQRLGVRGTPALFTADGQYLPGYLPAEDLAATLGIAR